MIELSNWFNLFWLKEGLLDLFFDSDILFFSSSLLNLGIFLFIPEFHIVSFVIEIIFGFSIYNSFESKICSFVFIFLILIPDFFNEFIKTSKAFWKIWISSTIIDLFETFDFW